MYAVDATTIYLCLAVFPWASFRRTKAAIKLHVGLDQAGHLPSFVSVTEGKTGDVKVARTWTFPAGSVVVADRAYLDFKWFHQLQARGVTFVTRLKRGVRYRVTREHDVRPGTGVLSDQTIELTSARSRKAYAAPLRRVAYQDPVTKNRYVFVTNNTTWVAQTIADIYKSRWQIELFFKWIKQHLKVKRFVGRSKNAVMTQLWVAMCMYLLLAYLKFVMRLRWSLHQMLQVLQLNMFERRPLQDLFTTPSLTGPLWLPIVAGVVLKMWDTSVIVQALATVALALFTYRLWRATSALASFTDQATETSARLVDAVGEMVKVIDKQTAHAHGSRLVGQWRLKSARVPVLAIEDERGEPLKINKIRISQNKEGEPPEYREIHPDKYRGSRPVQIECYELPQNISVSLDAKVSFRDVVTDEPGEVRITETISPDASDEPG